MDSQPQKSAPKSTGRRYSSVQELIKGERLSTEVSADVKKLWEETRIARVLAGLRCKAGLTQSEMGDRLNRTQGAISKLESGRDEDLTLGEVRAYATVLNERVGLLFGPPMNHVEAIKAHAEAMRRHMHDLAKIAGQDEQLEKEIQAFFGEALFNILTILASSLGQLPDKGDGIMIQLLGSKSGSAPAVKTEERSERMAASPC